MTLQKQTVINTIGNTTYLAAQWMLTVLTTRFLGYEEVGILTLAMSVGNIFTFIQFYGVRGFQSSDVSRRYTSGDYLVSRLITTSIGLILCVGFISFSGYAKGYCISIILFTLFRTFEAVSDVFFGEFQREKRLELVGYTMSARGIITVLLFYVGLLIYHDLNSALLIITFGSLCMTACIDYYLYRRIVKWNAETVIGVKGILKECFPLLIAALLPTVITAFPRIALERTCGTELLGFYGNISTPAVIITAIVPNILASIMPTYGEMVKSRDCYGIRKLWIKTLCGTIIILIFCSVIVCFFGKNVMAWIYTDDIVPYVPYLYCMLVSTTIYAFTMCGAAVLTALRKNIAVSTCALIATVICMIITFPMIKRYTIMGAIVVLWISYGIQAIIQACIVLISTQSEPNV